MSRGYSIELYESYLKFLEDGTVPEAVSSTTDNFKREAKKHTNLNGVLLRKGKLVLKVNELSSIWQTHHVSLGHPGNFFTVFLRKVFLPLNFQKSLKTNFVADCSFFKNYLDGYCMVFKKVIS